MKGWRVTATLCLACSILLCGCSSGKREEEQERMLSVVEAGESYAFVELADSETPVLLVTDSTYQDGEIHAGLDSRIYGMYQEEIKELGTVESMGTAYPIAQDSEGIYVSGPHFVKQYTVNDESQELEMSKYAEVSYEGEEEVHLYFDIEKGEGAAEDNAGFEELFRKYQEAEIVNYQEKK